MIAIIISLVASKRVGEEALALVFIHDRHRDIKGKNIMSSNSIVQYCVNGRHSGHKKIRIILHKQQDSSYITSSMVM